MVLNVCFCDPPFLYRIFTEKVFCRKDYLFFGLKTDLVDVIFLNSFHNRNNNLFEFVFEIEYNQVAWFILEKKMHSNNLVRYTICRIHDMTGNISQLSQTNPTCFFCPHKIPKLELLYHLRMWARRDLCIGNHLQQSSSTTLGTNSFWSWILYCCHVTSFLQLLF